MKNRDFARSIVADLRPRRRGDPRPRMSLANMAEYARCVAIVHAGDDFDFQRYGMKLLIRSTQRPGPKPDPELDKRIVEAIHWVRWNRRSLGVAKAIELAAKRYRVKENTLKNAYRGHVEKFRNLKPRRTPPK